MNDKLKKAIKDMERQINILTSIGRREGMYELAQAIDKICQAPIPKAHKSVEAQNAWMGAMVSIQNALEPIFEDKKKRDKEELL